MVRVDESCKIGLKHFLLAHGWSLPVNGIEIIKKLFEMDVASEYNAVCFCKIFEGQYDDRCAVCANKFKALLELALNEFS